MSTYAVPTVEQKFALALEQFGRKIRTFARNSFYKLPGYDVSDVEQELRVVLWDCVQTYNPDKGATFNTYFQQCAHNKIASLIRFAQAKTRVANTMTITLEDDAVRYVVENQTAQMDSGEIALMRMQLQDIAEEHGIEAVLNPKQRRRRRTAA